MRRMERKIGRIERKRNKADRDFEGEMANALENYINDAKEENDTAIQRTGDLVSSLGTQIEKLTIKFHNLKVELNIREV